MGFIAMGVDIEEGRSHHHDFDQTCRELFWEAEQRLIMHRLAKDYHGFRAFWVQSMPLLIITTFIAVIGFIQYGQYASNSFGVVDESFYAAARQWLALAVGILGLLSTILVSSMINTNHRSQRDMHALAERTLSKVCQSVRFPERTPGDDGTRIAEHINKQKAILLSVSCISSDIPPRIQQTFKELGHAMDTKPYTFRAIQYERFYYILWKSYTRRKIGRLNLWPWRIPDISISTNKLGKMIEDEYAKFSVGLKEAKRKDSSSRNSSVRSGSRCSDEERALLASSTSTTSSSTTVEV